jgi:hypothetical protein
MLKFLVGLFVGVFLAAAVADDLPGTIPLAGKSYLNTMAHAKFADEILAIQVDENGYVICSPKSK